MKKLTTTINSTLLKKYGYKITPARLAVLSSFSYTHKPLSAENIFIQVQKHKKINPATVYRTLTSFEKKGLIKKVNLRTDTAFYELAQDHHHHIVCTSCGRIEDFTECGMSPIIKKVITRSPHFARIQDHSVELFGVCNTCS